MPQIKKSPLPELERKARHLFADLKRTVRQKGILLGETYLRAKGFAGHGHWGDSCKRMGVSPQWANLCIQFFDHRVEIERDFRFNELGIQASVQLIRRLHAPAEPEPEPEPVPVPQPERIVEYSKPPKQDAETIKRKADQAAKHKASRSETDKLREKLRFWKQTAMNAGSDADALRADRDGRKPYRQLEIESLRRELVQAREREAAAEKKATYWEHYAKRVELGLARLSERME